MTETQLPVESFREAAPLLRRPFEPAAVRWGTLFADRSWAARRVWLADYAECDEATIEDYDRQWREVRTAAHAAALEALIHG